MNLLQTLRGKKVAIVIHANADPDAYGCAVALSELTSAPIVAPTGLNANAKAMEKNLGFPTLASVPAGTELVVVLDTGGPEQLSPLEVSEFPKTIVIDHHPRNKKWKVWKYLAKETPSCAEFLFGMIRPGAKGRAALLAGIIADTQGLRLATKGTFETVRKLMVKDTDYRAAMQLLSVETDVSQKIATLKAMPNLRFERVNNYLVAYCTCGSFEADIAQTLLFLGADVGLAASDKEKGSRVSGRARRELAEKIHLGRDVFEKLGGGGHPGAASANIAKSPEEALSDAVAFTKAALSSP